MTPAKFDTLVDDLRTGRLAGVVPDHGTLCRVRRAVGLPAAGAPPFVSPPPAAPRRPRRPPGPGGPPGPGAPGPAAAPASAAPAAPAPLGLTGFGPFGAAPRRGRSDRAATPAAAEPPPAPAAEAAAAATRCRRAHHRCPRPDHRPPQGPMTVTDVPKIVTRHLANPESWTLKSYVAADGYQGLRKALTMAREDVHEEVKKASLLGRGGAGFPAGQKWAMLRKSNDPIYLVVNGDESEPATFKDHMLIERDPHQIIEGTLITAYVIGAAQAFIYIAVSSHSGWNESPRPSTRPTNTAPWAGIFSGSGWSIDIVIHSGAGAYICGDETGLLESLEGKRGFPRIKPPFFPAAFGLYQAPRWSTTSRPCPTSPGW